MMMAARHQEREPPQQGRPETEKSYSQHDIDKYERGLNLGWGKLFHVFRSPSEIQSDQLTSYWEGHASLTNHSGDIKCTLGQEPTIKKLYYY